MERTAFLSRIATAAWSKAQRAAPLAVPRELAAVSAPFFPYQPAARTPKSGASASVTQRYIVSVRVCGVTMMMGLVDANFDEAVEEGYIKASHRFLLKVGRKLLGPPDSSVESALTSIQDVERLERMAEAILTVKPWVNCFQPPDNDYPHFGQSTRGGGFRAGKDGQAGPRHHNLKSSFRQRGALTAVSASPLPFAAGFDGATGAMMRDAKGRRWCRRFSATMRRSGVSMVATSPVLGCGS